MVIDCCFGAASYADGSIVLLVDVFDDVERRLLGAGSSSTDWHIVRDLRPRTQACVRSRHRSPLLVPPQRQAPFV